MDCHDRKKEFPSRCANGELVILPVTKDAPTLQSNRKTLYSRMLPPTKKATPGTGQLQPQKKCSRRYKDGHIVKEDTNLISKCHYVKLIEPS